MNNDQLREQANIEAGGPMTDAVRERAQDAVECLLQWAERGYMDGGTRADRNAAQDAAQLLREYLATPQAAPADAPGEDCVWKGILDLGKQGSGPVFTTNPEIADKWRAAGPVTQYVRAQAEPVVQEPVAVPREPTEAMLLAGNAADYAASTHRPAKLIWQAMYDAAMSHDAGTPGAAATPSGETVEGAEVAAMHATLFETDYLRFLSDNAERNPNAVRRSLREAADVIDWYRRAIDTAMAKEKL